MSGSSFSRRDALLTQYQSAGLLQSSVEDEASGNYVYTSLIVELHLDLSAFEMTLSE